MSKNRDIPKTARISQDIPMILPPEKLGSDCEYLPLMWSVCVVGDGSLVVGSTRLGSPQSAVRLTMSYDIWDNPSN